MLKKRFFKTKDEVEVTFTHETDGSVESVALAGDFTGWEPVAMKRKKKGVWTARHRLPKGAEHQFRYFVEGERWENDHDADGYRPNEHGSDNSVVTT